MFSSLLLGLSLIARRKDKMNDHKRARVELAVRFLWPIVLMLGCIGVFYLVFRRE
jgi:hypothetical protein